ncbi:MAG: universal stress protein [Candidatus Jettenia caeni]|nr:universal stress protein [Candidatus Jettenia caeni]
MYKKIFIAIDNSCHSNFCIDLGIDLSRKLHSHLIGCHVYDASLHQKRFRDMEKGLPQQYQDEKVLHRQRELHTSLINMGLKLISESYLDVFKNKCLKASVTHEELLLEGKNYYEISKEVQKGCYDLLILGALGLAAVDTSVVGSVCERVIRRAKTDILVVKNKRLEGKVVVAVDGSPASFSGVKAALTFAQMFDLNIDAVSVFDPHYHRVAFESIAKVLSKEAGQIFRFKEQETLHEEIIDKGLAKIYQNHLDQAKCIAEGRGVKINTILMDGKPYDQIIKYIHNEKPSLLILGRTGIHNTNGLDIGGTTENLLRLAPCNILLIGENAGVKSENAMNFSDSRIVPEKENVFAMSSYNLPMEENGELKSIDRDQELCTESVGKGHKLVIWTDEAQEQTERIPPFIRGVIRKKIEEFAQEKGYCEITVEVVNKAKAGLMGDSMLHKT